MTQINKAQRGAILQFGKLVNKAKLASNRLGRIFTGEAAGYNFEPTNFYVHDLHKGWRKEKELVHAQMLKDSLIRANAEKWIRKNTRESN